MKKHDFDSITRSLNQAVEIASKQKKAARVSTREIPDFRAVRERLNLGRADLAEMLGVSPRTLESWEQGRRKPSGAASLLLRIAMKNPAVVLEAMH